MKCSFCKEDIEKGTEKIFVTKRGDTYYFCSRKCEKNLLKLGRKPRKVRWTKDYQREKEARLEAQKSSDGDKK